MSASHIFERDAAFSRAGNASFQTLGGIGKRLIAAQETTPAAPLEPTNEFPPQLDAKSLPILATTCPRKEQTMKRWPLFIALLAGLGSPALATPAGLRRKPHGRHRRLLRRSRPACPSA
jgi:hypothetical protein